MLEGPDNYCSTVATVYGGWMRGEALFSQLTLETNETCADDGVLEITLVIVAVSLYFTRDIFSELPPKPPNTTTAARSC